jgi:hypothetical protein
LVRAAVLLRFKRVEEILTTWAVGEIWGIFLGELRSIGGGSGASLMARVAMKIYGILPVRLVIMGNMQTFGRLDLSV